MADPSVPFPSSAPIDQVIIAPRAARSFISKNQRQALLESAIGFGLIMATVWTARVEQRSFFWISAAWFACFAVLALWRGWRNLRRPRLKLSAILIAGGLLVAGSVLAIAYGLGTLHALFGIKNPLQHAGMYILWAIIQQSIQQQFFLHRFEQLTRSGLLASFTAAALFAVAHVPNPVLVPVTFLGGWLLSEIYRRYRAVLPLGIAHGLVGIAIALSVPDSIQHHMRVGLGYLTYPH
jgi:hypothetical protein